MIKEVTYLSRRGMFYRLKTLQMKKNSKAQRRFLQTSVACRKIWRCDDAQSLYTKELRSAVEKGNESVMRSDV